MAKFLTTLAALDEIEKIIKNARRNLVLMSPYFDIPELLMQNLKAAAGRQRVKITLVFGKSQLKPNVKSQLQQLDNLSLYFLENMHAKCFYNEQSMVITSMNLYDFSRNNKEMGVLINAKDEPQLFNDAVTEANRIINLSKEAALTIDDSRSYSSESKQEGYCIRCKAIRPYHNLERPFCDDCFLKWSRQKDRYHPERYCHTCGQTYPTSKAMPQCSLCFIKYQA
ncbi:MAG: phospholipase D-like domain-containing protein [Dehalococcoidales bacterium]|nr:phospholipase D-like domain-containing protein [Dehalococcoidales bacterium]